MEILNTQRKLREAQYFYRRLAGIGLSPGNASEEFWFELSAFLSAARSITFVLQSESKEAYEGWFSSWRNGLETEEQELLQSMNDHRVAEVHRTGVAMTHELKDIPVTQLRNRDTRHPAYGVYWFGPPGTPEPLMGIVEYFFQLGNTPASVVETCGRFLRLLQKAVADFVVTASSNSA